MNQAVNFLWTILCFIPVIGFWAGAGTMVWCYVFIGISFISLAIPARVLQLSNQPQFYQRLGVRIIRRFVQNGDLVNRLAGNARAARRVIKNKANAVNYMQTIAMYERYHLLAFVFFLLTALYAVFTSKYAMAAVILLANFIYNICPILLQQYNRVRLLGLQKNTY